MTAPWSQAVEPRETSWLSRVHEVLKRAGARRMAYVPDAGHSARIGRLAPS